MKLCKEAQVFTPQTCEPGIHRVAGGERQTARESGRRRVHGRDCMSERQQEREREVEEACGLEAGSNAQERAGCVLIKR